MENLIDDFIPKSSSDKFEDYFEEFKSQMNKYSEQYQKGIIKTLEDTLKVYIKSSDEFPEWRNTKEIININIGLNYCEEFRKEKKQIEFDPIYWKGDVKRFGAIINTLIELEYIEANRKPNGEVNYNETARQLKKIFKFNTDYKEKYLSEIINPESEKFGGEFSKKIKIPRANTNL